MGTDPKARVNAPYTVAPSGYRLPDEMSLGKVRLQVSDLDRSIAYYERVVGMRVVQRDDTRAELAAHGEDTILIELNELRGARAVPQTGRLGLYHFALLLPDRASLGRFIAHLAELGERAGAADHLVSEAVYLTDPDGLGIEVYADRPRESWKMTGQHLAMATDPLDMRGLVDAGKGAAWEGAPPGTRVGHVHLYVGDLGESAAFFHDALGLDRISLSFPGALFLSAGGYHHHLGTNTWAAHSPRTGTEDAQLLEWTMHLPDASDVDAAHESIKRAGFPSVHDGETVLATDPWGTRVRIRKADT